MSLPTNISDLGQQSPSWWMTYGARGMGCLGGIIAIILGVINCLTIYPKCIVAGVWLMLSGFVVVAAEAPCCCMFVDFIDRYSKWVEARPYWQKAVLYIAISIPALAICPGVTTFFGSAFIFVSGALYVVMAIGKKAPRSDMLATAESTSSRINLTTSFTSEPPPASKF